ncbi:MAG: hypothetical protein UT43_C0006G0021 [Parcubacteria group bacterium GW2011_GWC1_39_29]|nr:MAG: hypothetical protein UT43_C0006G0021 [Parcubacteria group bacterium GW2011_GWC1_39_29]
MSEQPTKSIERPIGQEIETLKRNIAEATQQKEWFMDEMERVQREIE